MKKVLIISASPRKGGNSDILCDEFAKGAREAGHEVENAAHGYELPPVNYTVIRAANTTATATVRVSLYAREDV